MNCKSMLTAFVCLCATTLSAQTPGPAPQAFPVDPAVRMGKLDNGLTYYLRYNKYPEHQADFYIAQKVGSIQEEENQRGLAHFLEHMCFNGTKHYPGDALVRYLEGLGVKFGAQLNAFTSIDKTVYNINNVPTARQSALDSCLLILHDWSSDLLLSTEEIDKERGVIHEEWRVTSNAIRRIYERSLPELMPGSRYGHRMPIGLMSVVDHFDPQALRDYYHKWYRPDLQAIIVVGDIDVDYMEAKIKELFGPIALPEHPAEREYLPVPDNDEAIVVCDKDKEQRVGAVSLMFKSEVYPDSLKAGWPYYMYSYARTMGVNMLARRLQELSLDPDVAFSNAGCNYGEFLVAKTKGALEVQTVPKDQRTYEALKAVATEVFRAQRFGFTPTEYARERAEYLSQLEKAYNNRDKRENRVFTQEYVNHFLDGEPIPGLEAEYKMLSTVLPQVPVDLVNQVFASLVSPSDTNLVVFAISPDKEDYEQPEPAKLLAAVHEARQMELTPYVDNVKSEPLLPRLPEKGRIVKEKAGAFGTTEWQLSNGVRVILKKTDFKDNEVQMTAYSPGGYSRYPLSDRINVDNLDNVIKASGLGNFTRTELDKALAGVQASVTPTVGMKNEYLDGSSTPKDLRTLFELVYLSFGEPRRDDKAIASLKAQMREWLRNKATDHSSAFRDTVSATMYAHHPWIVQMNEALVDSISYDRILQIYTDRFSDASDFTFVFCGNFDNDSIRLFTEQYLAALPVVKRSDKPVDLKFNRVKGEVMNRFERKMEQPQAFVLDCWHGECKDNLSNRLAVSVLGQVLDMRYRQLIREEMGAAYSIGTTGALDRNSMQRPEYVVQVVAPVKPETCDTVLLILKQELERVAEQGASDKELAQIKEYMQKTFKESERKNGVWMNRILQRERYGVDTYTGYEKALEALTSADVAAFARRILKDSNCVTVVMMPETDN